MIGVGTVVLGCVVRCSELMNKYEGFRQWENMLVT